MKRIFLLGPALLFTAAPAHATGGFDCWTAGRAVVLTGSFGNSVGTPIDAVFLQIAGSTFSTAGEAPPFTIVRSWFDLRDIRIDLATRNEGRIAIQLRARLGARGTGTGTLMRSGVAQPVRCELERMDL